MDSLDPFNTANDTLPSSLSPPEGAEGPAEQGKQGQEQQGQCVHPVHKYQYRASTIHRSSRAEHTGSRAIGSVCTVHPVHKYQ